MNIPSKSLFAAITLVAAGVAPLHAADDDGFVSLFDGKSLDGWKVAENPDSVTIDDGAILTHGEKAHVFYVGDGDAPKFDDFELQLDIKAAKNSNGGVYIHTTYQEKDWPAQGYEVQVNNTHKDERKGGGLYAVQDNAEAPGKDDEWMHYVIRVEGQRITVSIDGKQLVDYTEKKGDKRRDGMEGRFLLEDGGTIALQGHDPDSFVWYKNIKIKLLDQ